jgi:hypothetical protein
MNLVIAACDSQLSLRENDLAAIEAGAPRDLPANVANFSCRGQHGQSRRDRQGARHALNATAAFRPTQSRRFGVRLPPSSLLV